MTPDTSGLTSRMPFAFYDPESSFLRTSGVIFPWDSTESSPTLPRWGSMHGGALYELPTPVPLTDGSACSSLLPTPNAGPHNYDEAPESWLARRELLKAKGINGNGAGMPLGVAVKLLPTPTARDGKAGMDYRERAEGPDLYQVAARLLPTPTASDAKGSRSSTARRIKPAPARHGGDTLLDAAWTLSRLGDPSGLPSTDGPSASDDPHQPLWSDAS